MNTKFANTVKALGLLCLLVSTLAYADAKLEDFSVMASGPLDGRAVVKSADGKMTVLKVGDKLPGTEATLIQVLADKLVVEESVGKTGKPKVKQTAWLLKAAKPGARSTVQRFDSQGPVPVHRELTIMKPMGKGQDKAKDKTQIKAAAKIETKTKVEAKAKKVDAKADAKSKSGDKVKPVVKSKTEAEPVTKQ